MPHLDIFKKLDLHAFIEDFKKYFSREKKIEFEGSIDIAISQIKELDELNFTPPKKIQNLDNEILHLKKKGVLKKEQIFAFIQIINYFAYLKNLKLENYKNLKNWLLKIEIPKDLLNLANKFSENGEIKEGEYEELDYLRKIIPKKKKEIREILDGILKKDSINSYLVDKNPHLVNGRECLLLKSGWNKIIEGKVIHRTLGGYFYVFLKELQDSYEKLEKYNNELLEINLKIEEELSQILMLNLSFLRFINKQFDRFDYLQGRVIFAKEKNLNFLFPSLNESRIILSEFKHPILNNPKPLNLEWDKKILIVTGVNAGGKTMLLKSILSAALLSKLLIPFNVNKNKSKIKYFKSIHSIINDPQNSKNDISTFAGRMLEFKNILHEDNFLLGIDEIELGTDSNEAGALYFSILESLYSKNIKVVLTTHHKFLAANFSKNYDIDLLAAIYDTNLQIPTYTFMKDLIGKSYALEMALKYGIPLNIVNNAKKLFKENEKNLNNLVEKAQILNSKLEKKEAHLKSLIEENENKKEELEKIKEESEIKIRNKILELESTYKKAVEELKTTKNNPKNMHKVLNEQNKILPKPPKLESKLRFNIGDRVENNNNAGVIKSLNKNMAYIELDSGMKIKINTAFLKPSKKENKNTISHNVESKACGISLNLHGKRVEEAIEILDSYIHNCIIAKFSEVIIIHGSGVLGNAVYEFLLNHEKIKELKKEKYGTTTIIF